jgi:hypothetical protein
MELYVTYRPVDKAGPINQTSVTARGKTEKEVLDNAKADVENKYGDVKAICVSRTPDVDLMRFIDWRV